MRDLDIASIFNALAIIFIFGSILFLAYAASKLIGIKAGKMMKGKNIKVVESIAFGMDKQLHLVKVGEKFILLATSGKNIQMLTEIKANEMGETQIEKVVDQEGFDFKEFFDKYVDLFQKKISPVKNLTKGDSQDLEMRMVSDSKKTGGNLDRIRKINNKLKKPSGDGGDENSYDKTKDDKNRTF